jgi:tetratricopeptide (TPR) repeat protein
MYAMQGQSSQASLFFEKALTMAAEIDDSTMQVDILRNLAKLYYAQDDYKEAEQFLQRALAIDEKTLGPNHPEVATSLNNLANLYYYQGKYEQAEPLFQRAIAIGEKGLGPEHHTLATRLNNLATLYHDQGKYEQAELLFQHAIAIYMKTFGPHHPTTQTIQKEYALFQEEKKRKGR